MGETKLREKRLAKGWSQTKLACMAGVANSVISDCERNVRLPWRKAREALADALDCPVSEVFPTNGHSEANTR